MFTLQKKLMAVWEDKPPFKLLFVCAGNICRSPTAEGIMNQLVQQAGLEDKIFVDSAGTSSYHQGDVPDQRTIECADQHGLDLRCLRSRPVSAEDFARFDLIIAMDSQNVWNLDMKRPRDDERYQKAVVKKLLEYAPEFGEDVPDPYYKNGFDRVYQMIETACQNLLSEIRNKIN